MARDTKRDCVVRILLNTGKAQPLTNDYYHLRSEMMRLTLDQLHMVENLVAEARVDAKWENRTLVDCD